MFDVQKVGKNIAKLRKEVNMTQAELADAMNVSYQATSNWERGLSLPDISRLPELAKIFGCSVDELLGQKSDLVEHIINEDVVDFLNDDTPQLEDLAGLYPFLKPDLFETIYENVISSTQDLELGSVLALAPFLEQEQLHKLVQKVKLPITLQEFIGVCAFLNEEDKDYLVELLKPESVTCEILAGVIPLISEGQRGKLLTQVTDEQIEMGMFTVLAPFLNCEQLHSLVQKVKSPVTLPEFAGVCVFLNEEDKNYLAELLKPESVTCEILRGVIPLISEGLRGKLLVQVTDEQIEMGMFTVLAPFLSHEQLHALLQKVKGPITSWELKKISVFISEEDKEYLTGLLKVEGE